MFLFTLAAENFGSSVMHIGGDSVTFCIGSVLIDDRRQVKASSRARAEVHGQKIVAASEG